MGKPRLILAFVALAALTAFAPAPFFRPARHGEENDVSLGHLQGRWGLVRFDEFRSDRRWSHIHPWFTSVRISDDRWTYVSSRPEGNATFRITVRADRRLGAIDFSDAKGPPTSTIMVGIVRRQGNRLSILYYATTPENRAASFDEPPVNWWLLELERF